MPTYLNLSITRARRFFTDYIRSWLIFRLLLYPPIEGSFRRCSAILLLIYPFLELFRDQYRKTILCIYFYNYRKLVVEGLFRVWMDFISKIVEDSEHNFQASFSHRLFADWIIAFKIALRLAWHKFLQCQLDVVPDHDWLQIVFWSIRLYIYNFFQYFKLILQLQKKISY